MAAGAATSRLRRGRRVGVPSAGVDGTSLGPIVSIDTWVATKHVVACLANGLIPFDVLQTTPQGHRPWSGTGHWG